MMAIWDEFKAESRRMKPPGSIHGQSPNKPSSESL